MTSAPEGKRAAGVEVIAYSAEGFEEGLQLDRETLDRQREAKKLVWVRITRGGGEPPFELVRSLLDVHSLALDDLQGEGERPKAETFGEHSLLVLRAPRGPGELEFQQVSVLWSEDFVVSVEGEERTCFEGIAERLRNDGSKLRSRPAESLVYALIDGALDDFLPVVEGYRQRLEALEDRVIAHPRDISIYELHDLHHDLQALRHVLSTTQDMLQRAMRGDERLFSDRLTPYLRDCQDHLAQLLDAVQAGAGMVTSLVQLRNSQLDQRMNEIMTWLSLVSTLFIPLSFLVGLYGMNFDRDASPWNMPETRWYYAYPVLLGVLLSITVGFLWYFRRRGWIGRGAARSKGAQRRRNPKLGQRSDVEKSWN